MNFLEYWFIEFIGNDGRIQGIMYLSVWYTNSFHSRDSNRTYKDASFWNQTQEKLGNKKIHEILSHNKVRYINFIEWEVIDKEEVKNGKPKGKPREKFTYTEEMLSLLT